MQAPTRLKETIKGRKVNKPFKQKTHPKALCCVNTHTKTPIHIKSLGK